MERAPSLDLSPGERFSQALSTQRPRVFLIPGVFGDEPQLANLRLRLQESMNLELLEIPDGRADGRVLTDMVATGRLLADEIERLQPFGDVSLAGYSFGASAALEVAAQLVRRERHIAFLGILDGPFTCDELPGGHAELRDATNAKGVIRKAVICVAGSVDETRRAVLTLASPAMVGPSRSDTIRRGILLHLRNKALQGWTPPSCSAPGVHVFTGDYGPSNAARWAELCPNLEQVHVEVKHEHLPTDALEALATAFTSAL